MTMIAHDSANANPPAPLAVADWLSLAAAPAFAAMALLSELSSGSAPDLICSALDGASPLSGMGLMYALMSAVHLAPWLRLFASRRGSQRG